MLGLTALSGAGSKEAKAMIPPTTWDVETDVVILGAGGAGLMASIEAAKAKANVMLLESRSVIGGTSAICGGGVVFAGTDMQQKMGIQDSNQLLYDDLMQVGKH